MDWDWEAGVEEVMDGVVDGDDDCLMLPKCRESLGEHDDIGDGMLYLKYTN